MKAVSVNDYLAGIVRHLQKNIEDVTIIDDMEIVIKNEVVYVIMSITKNKKVTIQCKSLRENKVLGIDDVPIRLKGDVFYYLDKVLSLEAEERTRSHEFWKFLHALVLDPKHTYYLYKNDNPEKMKKIMSCFGIEYQENDRYTFYIRIDKTVLPVVTLVECLQDRRSINKLIDIDDENGSD